MYVSTILEVCGQLYLLFFFLLNYWKTWLQLCLWCFHLNGCLIKYLFSSYNSYPQSGTAVKMKVRAQLEHPFLHKVKALRIVSEIHSILKFMLNMSLALGKVKLSDISVKKETNITIQSILIIIKFKEHSSIATIVSKQINTIFSLRRSSNVGQSGSSFSPINRATFPFQPYRCYMSGICIMNFQEIIPVATNWEILNF